jgi:hypothetical protein
LISQTGLKPPPIVITQVQSGADEATEVQRGRVPRSGVPGSVSTISASLFYADSTTTAATSDAVPISIDGKARIEDTLMLPGDCLGPCVLVHPSGDTDR